MDAARALAIQFPPLIVDVERGRLRFFAQSIGETNPVYRDVEAARAAGHRDIPVPPTFFFSLSLERPGGLEYLVDVGVDLRHILHGEQSFDYHEMAYAGDSLVLQERIVDVVAKRGGAMDLITKRTEVYRGAELVADCRMVIVAMHEATATA